MTDRIRSGLPSPEYDEGWERTFSKKEKSERRKQRALKRAAKRSADEYFRVSVLIPGEDYVR